MGGFGMDLRYAARMLFKNPWVSAVAVGALGLGIGVTATMFSIVYAALMRGLPFEDGDRIVALALNNPSREIERQPLPIHDFQDLRDQQTALESMAGYYEGTVNIRWADAPERFDGAFVTANTFSVVGAQPLVGRLFEPGEDLPGSPMRLVLSYHVWQDRFAGDPGALGQVVKVNGETAEIIGVMPEGFLFPNRNDVWVPLRMDALAVPRGQGMGLFVVGKLQRGVSVEQASTELNGIAARLAAAYPDTNEGVGVTVLRYSDMFMGTEVAALLYTMLGAVALVLLIACANVANLLLARAAVRAKEVGIRTAMGASRWRVVSQMVTEALALALAGGVLGTVLAWVGIGLFDRAVAGTNPPFFMLFQLDAPILLFILAISILSALLAGGIPALKASGLDVSGILKDESRGSSSLRIGRLSNVLVVGEIAMSMGLLVAAGLMTKSIATLRNLDLGFDADALFTARVGLFEAEFPDTLARRRFYGDLRLRLQEIPGIRAASLGVNLPGLGSGETQFAVEGQAYAEDRDYPRGRYGQVDAGFFDALGLPVTVGREFLPSDDGDGDPVAVVNESFAQKYLGGGSPVGRRIRVGDSSTTEPWLTVVGVVPDAYMHGIGNRDTDPAGLYVPIQQSDARFMSILARGPGDPMTLTAAVRDAVTSVSPDTPIYFVNTLKGRIAENTWAYNVFGVLFMVFGGVALFLASVGLYAVMAFTVSRRTAEVGIRMALGAEARQVLRLVLRQGMVQILFGLVIGLGLAALLSRAARMLLFQTSAADPAVYALVSLVLVATGLAASFVPARRATRVDPLTALRSE
jgi:predicted permease